MKLRIRRSGRHRTAPQPEPAPAADVAAALHNAGQMHAAGLSLTSSLVLAAQEMVADEPERCQGVTYRGRPCTLDAGPDGYCVFHKPGATA